jgi:hypothetical protein
MGSRDHSSTCKTCGLQRGGLNNLKCRCDMRVKAEGPLVVVEIDPAIKKRSAAEVFARPLPFPVLKRDTEAAPDSDEHGHVGQLWLHASDIRLSVEPGTRQIFANSGNKELRIRADESNSLVNRFVFPPGITEIVLPPHGAVVFVAEKPSRWQRLWCWLTRRGPALRWRYQPGDQEAQKVPPQERTS